MSRFYLFSFLLIPFFLQAQTNMTFRSVTYFPGHVLANVWGYTAGGHEYALVGEETGMFIIDITNPDAPVQVAMIPGPTSDWKEIKTYQHYAYVVSEGGMGVQVVDLNGLPGSSLTYHSVYPVVTGQGTVTKAHALHVDEVKGYLYLYGTNIQGGIPIICNLNGDPYNPVYAGKYNGNGYCHDGYASNDTLFGAHLGNGVSIVNTTNKANPVNYGPPFPTPNNFTHNTWRSGNALFTTDETSASFLSSYDITDPNDVDLLDKIKAVPGSNAIVHNTYVKNNYAVTSWYKDGVAIVDVSRPANMVVTGIYDTYSGSGSGFSGCWGVYPYFPSGTIIASNITGTGAHANDGELYVLTPTYVRGCYLEGLVTDASTGNPLPGAFVELLSSGVAGEITPTSGLYKMARNGGGPFTLRASKTGYYTQDIPVTLASGVLTIQNIALVPAGLPVEMTRFDAQSTDYQTAILTWETAHEKDNAGFDIQRSRNSTDWETIGFEASCSDGRTNCSYQFETSQLQAGEWYFRLNQRDNSGASTLSDIRSVIIYDNRVKVTIAPNPAGAAARAFINTGKDSPEEITVALYAENGQNALFSANISTSANGLTELPLSMENYPAGYYLLRVIVGSEVINTPFIKK